MTADLDRDLGPQPLAALLDELELRPHDLVAASSEQLTHKQVSRGARGRRLTPNMQRKVLAALRTASGREYGLSDLFSY